MLIQVLHADRGPVSGLLVEAAWTFLPPVLLCAAAAVFDAASLVASVKQSASVLPFSSEDLSDLNQPPPACVLTRPAGRLSFPFAHTLDRSVGTEDRLPNCKEANIAEFKGLRDHSG